MKNHIILGLLVAMAVTSGCAKSTELIRTGSISTRSDVFQELADGGPIPQGYADLRIVSSLKTHKPGIYSAKDIHGTPEYRLLVNIDGQVSAISASLQKENIEPRRLRDPEAGEGVRYWFGMDVRLKAGTHRIIVAIPNDKIAFEREITLAEGSSNRLVLEPLYGPAAQQGLPAFYGPTSFYGGVNGFRVILNGKGI